MNFVSFNWFVCKANQKRGGSKIGLKRDETGRLHIDTALMAESLMDKTLLDSTDTQAVFRALPDLLRRGDLLVEIQTSSFAATSVIISNASRAVSNGVKRTFVPWSAPTRRRAPMKSFEKSATRS